MPAATLPCTERRPALPGWVEIPIPPDSPLVTNALAVSAWQNGATCVLSSLVLAELPDKSGIGPQWHISVTHLRKRPKEHDLRRMCRAFDFFIAEEDNHHPGNARHFFLPVNPAHRVDCECKVEEQIITATATGGRTRARVSAAVARSPRCSGASARSTPKRPRERTVPHRWPGGLVV